MANRFEHRIIYMKKIICLTFLAISAFRPYSTATAQVGMGGMGGGELFAISLLSQRNECRATYPSMAEVLDTGLNNLIDRNSKSFTRKTWIRLSTIEVDDVPKLTKVQCEQLSVALSKIDLNSMIVGMRETMCENALRTLEYSRRRVIRIGIDETSDVPRISKVEPDGPASLGGLRVGDEIEEFGEKTTPTACQLALAISDAKAGEDTEVVFSRAGTRMQTQVRPLEIAPVEMSLPR